MKTLLPIALAVTMMLAGCAQFSFDAAERGLSERERRYNAALRTLTDGSTRADLERLFPCVRPRSFNPGIFTVGGVFIFPPEEHPIDKDFAVSVSYAYVHLSFVNRPHGHYFKRSAYGKLTTKQISEIDSVLFGRLLIHPAASDRIQNLPLRVERRHPRT